MATGKGDIGGMLAFVVASDRRKDALRFLLFVGGYAALLVWFKYVDVYHTHFSATGPLILVHNLFRVLFVFYLFWIVQAVGAWCLRLLGGCELRALATADYLALTFFAGTGPWHVALLAVGYANLLNVPVMVALTFPVVALSFGQVRSVATDLRSSIAERSRRTSAPVKACCVLLVIAWCGILLTKGLYPGGSLDYFAYYFPAYESVIDRGSIRPAEMWWHYLNSKGAGLFYLAMLITDPLAPALVIFCFISAAGLATLLLVRRVAPRTAWPIVAVLLFFGIYEYTPTWGEFGKLHEFNTSFVVTILWMTVVALDAAGAARRLWLVGAASAITAAIVINPPIGVLLGAIFFVLASYYAAMRERARALVCLGVAALAGSLFAAILLLNFFTVGLPYDIGIGFWWRIADVEKLYRWGALPMLLFWDWKASLPAVSVLRSLLFVDSVLRLYLLWPLFFGGLFVMCASLYRRYRARDIGGRPVSDAVLASSAALLVTSVLYLASGRLLGGSFFRFASFTVPIVIVAGIAMWTAPGLRPPASSVLALARHPRVPFLVLAVCAGVIVGRTPIDRHVLRLGADALEYAVGALSIDGAYARQSSGLFNPPWGGIYPGARAAFAIVGPHARIWTMHLESTCMLPDCRMTTSVHAIMTPSWDRLMWGTPEDGRSALRAAGVNYFLVSRELDIRDPLPLSPLFSPDNIGRYLGIRWTDGTTTLLTWSGRETTALDDAWLSNYRRAVAASGWVKRFSRIGMKTVFDRLHAMPHPWRPVDLPWRAR